MESDTSSIDGVLNINKPRGITSMEVVRRIKRASGQKRVGHGGTLDPIATGVVPICLGQATRFMEFMLDGTKEYRAVIELGAATDTYDAEGEVVTRGEYSNISRDDVERALVGFKGEIQQVPPMYSALKKDGKRLYELARAGIEVERKSRDVSVYEIALADWNPPDATVNVRCGRGFYMRSLAHDLGAILGCGGHLKELDRTRSGIFNIENAVSVEIAEQRFHEGSWHELVFAPDTVLRNLPVIIVGRNLETMIRHGRPLPASVVRQPATSGEKCRAYGVDGAFIAIVKFDKEKAHWKPDKVFSLQYPRPKALV